MERKSFLDILMVSTPEELSEYIATKGSKKMVNAITFLDDETYNQEHPQENQ